MYFATLLATAVTIAMFVAPSANHRLLFHKWDKGYIVIVANRLAIAGIGLLALSMCGTLLLVGDIVFDNTTAAVTTAVAAALFAWLWFVVPMIRRGRLEDESLSRDGHGAGAPSRRRR